MQHGPEAKSRTPTGKFEQVQGFILWKCCSTHPAFLCTLKHASRQGPKAGDGSSATIRPLCFNADKAAAAARSPLVLDLLLINAYVEAGEACLLAYSLMLLCVPDGCMVAVQSAFQLIVKYDCWPCCS